MDNLGISQDGVGRGTHMHLALTDRAHSTDTGFYLRSISLIVIDSQRLSSEKGRPGERGGDGRSAKRMGEPGNDSISKALINTTTVRLLARTCCPLRITHLLVFRVWR